MTNAGRRVGLIILAVVVLAVFAVYVWPTAWTRCDTGLLVGEQLLAIDTRVNRFTGRVEGLTITGWQGPEPAAAPVAQPAVPGPGMAPAAPQPTE